MAKAAPVLWFTGLSGAGKSTLARRIQTRLADSSIPVELLDGDEIRAELSSDLGFTKADRDTQVRRLGYLAHLLSRNGIVVLVSAISPYQASRSEAIRRSPRGLEIFVEAELAVVQARDTKGLYRKAEAGEITGLTGYDDPYEAPTQPAIRINTGQTSIETSTEMILDLLAREGIDVVA